MKHLLFTAIIASFLANDSFCSSLEIDLETNKDEFSDISSMSSEKLVVVPICKNSERAQSEEWEGEEENLKDGRYIDFEKLLARHHHEAALKNALKEDELKEEQENPEPSILLNALKKQDKKHQSPPKNLNTTKILSPEKKSFRRRTPLGDVTNKAGK